MRKVSSLLLASLLIATVMATDTKLTEPLFDMNHAPHAKKTVMHAAQTVMEHLAKVHQNTFIGVALSAAKTLTEPRSFEAKADTTAAPSGTCDQEGYSAAQVVVLQACPSLSGLISGTVALTDFLPGFCGSNCYKVIAANLPKYGVCLDSSTKPLVEFVTGCATKPECYGETALKTGLQISAACGSGATNLFNFYAATSSAKSSITEFCTTCLPIEVAYIKAYPRCVAADATAAAGLSAALTAMCTQTGGTTGDYCAWNLRSIGKIDCTNNCYSSDWCDNSCNLAMTTSRLDTMCNNKCLASLASVAPAVGADKVLITALSDLFCSAAPNSTQYCYLTAQSALSTYNPSSSSAMATTCAGNNGVCLSTFFTLSSALAAASARSTFATCAASLSSGTYLYSYCQAAFERGLGNAELLRTQGNLVCATNAAGGYCAVSATTFGTSTCFQFAVGGSCSASCATTLAGYATTAGCCLGLINDYLRASNSRFYASYLPTGTFTATLKDSTTVSYTFSPEDAIANPDRSLQPLNALAVCSNTTDLWTSIETPCAASTNAVARSFSVRLSYAAVTANAATRKRILGGLKADAANAANVPPSSIKNETISEDTSITITTSRRASATGVKFSFVIDGASSTDVANAASYFDSAAKTGVATANTGNAATSCTGCLASGQDAASLSSGGSSGGGSSSASFATAAFAAVAAFAALLL